MNPNANPRIGVLLALYSASNRLKTVLRRFHKRGLKWLRTNWPEVRMRRELRGYGPKCSREWQAILARRRSAAVLSRSNTL